MNTQHQIVSQNKNIPKWLLDAKTSNKSCRESHASHILNLAKKFTSLGFPLQIIRGKQPFTLDANNKRWTILEIEQELERYIEASGRWKNLKEKEYNSSDKTSGWMGLNLGILGGYHRKVNEYSGEKEINRNERIGPYVIDVDATPNSETIKPFNELLTKANIDYRIGLPTLTIRTGRGGNHYYFKMCTELEGLKYRSGIIPYVDIKCTGGFVVAPYSVHPNGEGYYVQEDGNIVTDFRNVKRWVVEYMPSELLTNILLINKSVIRVTSSTKYSNNNLTINGSSKTNKTLSNDIIKRAIDLFKKKYPKCAEVLLEREIKGNLILLQRINPGPCPLHPERTHDSENPYLIVRGCLSEVYYDCRRGGEESLYVGTLSKGINRIDKTINWNIFVNEICNTTITIETEKIQLQKLKKVAALIIQDGKYIFVLKGKHKNIIYAQDILLKQLRYSGYFLKQDVDTEKKKYKTLFTFVLENIHKIQYNTAELNPTPLGMPIDNSTEKIFNLWTGFKVSKKETYDEEIIQPIVNHIRDILCNNNLEVFSYVINWIAHIFQHPNELPGTALVFKSKQGAGKSIISKMLMDMIGTAHSTTINNLDALCKYNGFLEGCVFLECNEISAFNKKYISVMNTIITDKTQRLEDKYIKSFQATNNSRIWINSNDETPIKITASDRRIVVIQVNNKYAYEMIKNTDKYEEGMTYGKNLAKYSEKTEVQEHFATYLMSISLDNWNPRMIPETEEKLYIQLLSAEPIDLWWSDYVANTENKPMEAKNLKILFMRYCENNCIKYPHFTRSNIAFAMKLSKMKGIVLFKGKHNITLWHSDNLNVDKL